MAGKAHFRVVGRLDMGRPTSGTVTITRGPPDHRTGTPSAGGLFTVRPHRRRRTYELPLEAVADMVVARVIRAEVLERRLAKKKKRVTD